jgi:hypothetical protein
LWRLNPDARVRAAADIIGVDLASLLPAQQLVVHWRNVPVF